MLKNNDPNYGFGVDLEAHYPHDSNYGYNDPRPHKSNPNYGYETREDEDLNELLKDRGIPYSNIKQIGENLERLGEFDVSKMMKPRKELSSEDIIIMARKSAVFTKVELQTLIYRILKEDSIIETQLTQIINDKLTLIQAELETYITAKITEAEGEIYTKVVKLVEDSYAKYVEETDEKIAEINSTITTLETKESHNLDISNLNTRISAIITALSDYETKLDHEADISGLSSRIDAIISSLSNYETIANHQADIDDLRSSIEDNLTKITDLSFSLALVRSNLSTINTTLSNLDKRVTNNANDIETIDASVNEVRASITTTNNNVANITQSINTLSTNVNNNSSSIVNINSNITTIKAKNTEIENKVNTNTTNISNIAGNVSSILTDVSSLETTVAKNTTDITTLSARVDKSCDTMEEYVDTKISQNNVILNKSISDVLVESKEYVDQKVISNTLTNKIKLVNFSYYADYEIDSITYVIKTFNSEWVVKRATDSDTPIITYCSSDDNPTISLSNVYNNLTAFEYKAIENITLM